jgi:hypothetical protein
MPVWHFKNLAEEYGDAKAHQVSQASEHSRKNQSLRYGAVPWGLTFAFITQPTGTRP